MRNCREKKELNLKGCGGMRRVVLTCGFRINISLRAENSF